MYETYMSMDETLMCMDDTFMCMDKIWMDETYVYGWESWMDEIFLYDCCVWLYICIIMCIYVIFQFKTGVKLKWTYVEPLEHNNFWQLGKNHKK
jgi:hypothetical protein